MRKEDLPSREGLWGPVAWRQVLKRTLTAPLILRLAERAAGLLALPPVARLRPLVAAWIPQRSLERLKAALVGLWLLESFLASTLIIAVINWMDDQQVPISSGLAVAAIVILPSLILVVRWKLRDVMDEEARWAAEHQWQARAQASTLARAYRILYLQPGAPLHIAQAAYVAAMKKGHPDVASGNDKAAREFNWAIETIRDHARSRGEA